MAWCPGFRTLRRNLQCSIGFSGNVDADQWSSRCSQASARASWKCRLLPQTMNDDLVMLSPLNPSRRNNRKVILERRKPFRQHRKRLHPSTFCYPSSTWPSLSFSCTFTIFFLATQHRQCNQQSKEQTHKVALLTSHRLQQ